MNKGQETIKNISNICLKEPNKHAQTEISRIRTSLVVQCWTVHLPKRGHGFDPWFGKIHMPQSN